MTHALRSDYELQQLVSRITSPEKFSKHGHVKIGHAAGKDAQGLLSSSDKKTKRAFEDKPEF